MEKQEEFLQSSLASVFTMLRPDKSTWQAG